MPARLFIGRIGLTMTGRPHSLPEDFLAYSQEIGSDPMLVQGPGGNTSVKDGGIMRIKSSGCLLAEAGEKEIFVAVDVERAKAEIHGTGDGSCREAVVQPRGRLRPSIETTFHALLPQRFVFHYHSVASICHTVAGELRSKLAEKLAGLDWASVGYSKPGLPLTRAILELAKDGFPSVILLDNHGIIVAADSVAEVRMLVLDVEDRLMLPRLPFDCADRPGPSVQGWDELPRFSPLANDPRLRERVAAGSYYPDHVVFLGPSLPKTAVAQLGPESGFTFPAALVDDRWVYLKSNAGSANTAMLQCLYDVLTRIPPGMKLTPIGAENESLLLNWDAEKYRQEIARVD